MENLRELLLDVESVVGPQRKCAELAGVAHSTWQCWKIGKRNIPGQTLHYLICRLNQVPDVPHKILARWEPVRKKLLTNGVQ